MKPVVERLLRYVAVDTKADPENEACPSSPGQLELGALLVEELKQIGLEDASMDEYGYVFATLPANTDKEVPTIGFLAHMDTSPDMDGKCTNPQILEYQGGDIKLSDTVTATVERFPVLKDMVGETLITTDGTTLLGADNKAGIAIIMTAMDYLANHPEVEHGRLKVAFTPDEEIGRGPLKFDVERFDADFAYTMDGGLVGELEYESFNAAGAKIEIAGENIHPGTAKDRMINSQLIAFELHSMLPELERPEHTEGYEGFYLLTGIHGAVEHTKMQYIIRDHDKEKFEAKKANLTRIVEELNEKYGNRIALELKDTYYNMRPVIEEHMELIDIAKEAFAIVGVEPVIQPIRGGTDGSQLSYMGLPTPNIFTGGFNYHGKYEMATVSVMEKATDVVIHIANLFAKKA